MIVYRRLINMVPGGQVAVVNMSQYDSDVTLEFELYASEGTFVVQDGTTVLIRGTKPDGNGISLDGTLESTQDPETGQYVHLVTVEVTQQMTAVAGKALYELSLRKDDVELNTANFVLDIERAPLDADTVPSESVIREIDKAVEKYMDEHDIVIDDTLTQQGKAADAKAVRDALSEITGLSDDAKVALLNCFAHVAWIDEHGQDYYDALEEALYSGSGLKATFAPEDRVFYSDESVDVLKPYLLVRYNGAVIAAEDYTLTGSLSNLENIITIEYGGETTTVIVNAVVLRYIQSSDIASSVGYTGISISEGTVTPTSVATFSVLTYVNNFLKYTLPQSSLRIAYRKDGNNYYVTDGTHYYLFTKNMSKYDATDVSETERDNAQIVGNPFGTSLIASLDLENNVLTVAVDNDNYIEIANANVIGYWGANNALGINIKFLNAKTKS